MQIKNLAFWLVNKSAIQKENGFFEDWFTTEWDNPKSCSLVKEFSVVYVLELRMFR